MESEEVGVLVVRAWKDSGAHALRVRLSSRLDVEGDGVETQVAGSIEATCAAVRSWLETFLAG